MKLSHGTAAGLLVLALLAGDLSGQLLGNGDQGNSASGEAKRRGLTQVALTRVTTEIGLDDTYTFGNTHMGGVAWVDYNGDYLPDLFITNGGGLPHYLYRNDGDGTFTDVSNLVPKTAVGLEDGGVCFADIDNDGDEDIFVYVDNPDFSIASENVAEGGPNQLYLNNGDGTFVEVAAAYEVVDPRGWRNNAAGFADYDRDGFIDLYVGHWQRLNDPVEGVTDYDRLLHNDGDGTFTDVTSTTRVDSYGRDVLTNLWFDANMDGWPDLYVANTGPETGLLTDMDSNDILYLNDPSVPWFWDHTGNPRAMGDDTKAAMGMDVGDIDNDGDWDLYITDVFILGPEPFGNPLYLGNGDGTFSDNVADQAGVQSLTSWPCNFADFDLDGWTDLWVGTNNTTDPEFLYVNNKDGTFTDAAIAGFDGNGSRGGSVADFDADGDMDIAIWTHDGDTCIYRNDTITNRNWVEFKLFGTTSNRSAIGAKIWVTAGGITQLRRVSGGDSAHSQMDLVVNFGVNNASSVDVVIDWPSGAQDSFFELSVDQLHFIEEGTGLLPEVLIDSVAWWDSSDQTLLVAAITSYGGRAVHNAPAYGLLPYTVTQLGYRGLFEGVPANPGTVTVESNSGASWVLNVTTVP